MIMPVKKLIALCKKYGVLTLIDGAHAPGQIELHIEELGADFYSGVSCIYTYLFCIVRILVLPIFDAGKVRVDGFFYTVFIPILDDLDYKELILINIHFKVPIVNIFPSYLKFNNLYNISTIWCSNYMYYCPGFSAYLFLSNLLYLSKLPQVVLCPKIVWVPVDRPGTSELGTTSRDLSRLQRISPCTVCVLGCKRYFKSTQFTDCTQVLWRHWRSCE